MRFGWAIVGVTLVTAQAATAAPLRIARTTVLPTPVGVCDGIADPSTPTVAADPSGRDVVATALLRGGVAAAVARSRDGGRTFSAAPLTGLTGCSGAAPSHEFLVNPRGALGADGTAWFGSSWGGSQDGQFAYGVEAAVAGGETLRPEGGSAQDIAILPDVAGPGARALWTRFDQVPNPFTYLPSATRVRTATVRPDGAIGPVTTALQAPADELFDDPSLVRPLPGTLVAVASVARYADLVTFLNPATADRPIRFRGVSAYSKDGGATWSPGGAAGAPALFALRRDGVTFTAGLSDVAAGDGRVVRVWAEPPADGRGRIVGVSSRDGGRTWSSPMTLVDVPVAAVTPSVAVLPGGRIALSWYDARSDVEGDGRLDLRPWAAIVAADGERDEAPLGPAFDVAPLVDPGYPVDATALGVTQDLVALPAGFGTVHTEPAPAPGVTRVVYTRLSTRAKARKASARRVSGPRRPASSRP